MVKCENLVGKAAHEIRVLLSWTQAETAKALGISTEYLENIELGNTKPDEPLLVKFYELFGIDLYVFGWCKFGAIDDLPPHVQQSAAALTAHWNAEIDRLVKEKRRPFELN